MNPLWAADIVRQCKAAGTAVFFKQWGDYLPQNRVADNGKKYRTIPVFQANGEEIQMLRVGKKKAGRKLLGRKWSQFPRTEGAE